MVLAFARTRTFGCSSRGSLGVMMRRVMPMASLAALLACSPKEHNESTSGNSPVDAGTFADIQAQACEPLFFVIESLDSLRTDDETRNRHYVRFPTDSTIAMLNPAELLFTYLAPVTVMHAPKLMDEAVQRLDVSPPFERLYGRANALYKGIYKKQVYTIPYGDLRYFAAFHREFVELYPSNLTRKSASEEFAQALLDAHNQYNTLLESHRETIFVAKVSGLTLAEDHYDPRAERFRIPLEGSESVKQNLFGMLYPGLRYGAPHFNYAWFHSNLRDSLTIDVPLGKADELVAVTKQHPGDITFLFRIPSLTPMYSDRDDVMVGTVDVIGVRLELSGEDGGYVATLCQTS